MTKRKPDFLCIKTLSLSDPVIENNKVKATVTVSDFQNHIHRFQLMNTYAQTFSADYLPFLRLAFCMPMLNYGLFTQTLELKFPVSQADFSLLNDLNVIFSRDIYVNKIVKGNNPYVLQKFFPNPDDIKPEDADPRMTIQPTKILADTRIDGRLNSQRCGILSSGGKDSLLTYGLLQELGAEVYPLYVNESGGHWKTAVSAYRYHEKVNRNTQRVWTNVDRFYVFMLDHLSLIRSDHRKKWADIYPIRLSIFPFYVFSLLPIFAEKKIGSMLLGSEFDDVRTEVQYKGIKHYFGLYDQHQDYDVRMNEWYKKRIPGLVQWSALRNISGLVDQRILVQRYGSLAKYQRSCHSCHVEKGEIYPCGKCLKCLGVLLFLLAHNADPILMNYRKKDIDYFYSHITTATLSLDSDEKNQALYLLEHKTLSAGITPIDHVEKIHLDPAACDPTLYPAQFRQGLLDILKQYTTGFCTLRKGKWIPTETWTEQSSTVVS